MQETRVWSLGWEDPLEKGVATHSSILAWRFPWRGESGGLQSMGSQRVRHDWVSNTFREWLSLSLWPPSSWSSSLHLECAPTIWGSSHLPLKNIKMPNTYFHVSQWLPGSAKLLNQLRSGIGDTAPRNLGQEKSILKTEVSCNGSFLQVPGRTTNPMTRASAEDHEESESHWEWWWTDLLGDWGNWCCLRGSENDSLVLLWHSGLASLTCHQNLWPHIPSFIYEGNDAEKAKWLAQGHTTFRWQSLFTSSGLEILKLMPFEFHWTSEKKYIPIKPLGCWDSEV